MQLTGLDLWFWALTFVGHVVLLTILWVRRYAADLPFFFALIAMEVVRTVALFWIRSFGATAQYRNVYWSFAILDVVLELGVIYELASHVFRPLGKWTNGFTKSFMWLGLLSMFVATELTRLGAPATRSWTQWIALKGSFFFAALMSELFVGMLALSANVGLPWRHHVSVIAQGFGIYSIFDLLIEAAHYLFGKGYASLTDQSLSRARIGGYLLCLVYWAIALWRYSPNRDKISQVRAERLLRLQQQSANAAGLLRRWRR